MNLKIQIVTLLTMQVFLVSSTDLCNSDSIRFHLRNACSKLSGRYSRSADYNDFSDYNVTIVPGHKEYSHKSAKKLTHRDMPGAYILIYHPHAKFVHSKNHHHSHGHIHSQTSREENYNQERTEYQIVPLNGNDEISNYEYRHVKNLNKHHNSNEHKVHHRNMGAYAYQHNEEENESPEIIGLSDERNRNEQEKYEIIASDILTIGMQQSQRRHREVVGTDNHQNELRIRRQNIHIQKCCENPKMDECDWLLCE